MKNRRLLAILFTLAIAAALIFTLSVSADVSDTDFVVTDGTTFTADEEFKFGKAPTEFPLVIDTTVKFPADYTGNGGIVFSSCPEKGRANSMWFEIYDGHPRVRVQPTNSHTYYNFSEVSVYTGEWVNIRIVFDVENAAAHCYVDGVLAQTLNLVEGTVPHALKAGRPFTFANDEFTADYAQRFKGAIKSLALYSDSKAENPICIYDLTDADNADIIPDLSGNGHYITRKGEFAGGTELTGTVPASDNFYKVNKTGFKNFATVELMLRGDSDDYGVIYSNYVSSKSAKGTNLIRLETDSAGHLKLMHWGPTAVDTGRQLSTQTVIFESINVLDGQWRNIAIVRDDASDEYRLYVNGALAETVSVDIPDEIANMTLTQATHFGRDNRTGTYDHFTGELMNFATFADVRTATEICQDIVSAPDGADNLLAYYDFRFTEGEKYIADRSGNEAHLVNNGLPEAVAGEGYTPDTSKKEKPVMSVLPDRTPKTIEFTVKFPENYEYRADDGRVIGNRCSGSDARYFGIYDVAITNGSPWIYIRNLESKNTSVTFTDVVLPKGEWVNVAITVDSENKTVSCYVNGELKQTVNSKNETDFALNPDLPMMLGWNNLTAVEKNAFSGAIKSVALYSDVRNATEIFADRFGPEMDGSLIAYYDTELDGYQEDIKDLSYNDNHLINNLSDKVSYADETAGTTFDDEDMYQSEKMLDKTPLTLEAVIKYPESGNGKKYGSVNALKRQTAHSFNVIFGNYYIYTEANVLNFEIDFDNHPSVYAIDSLGNDFTYTFDKVTVNNDRWDHVAITFDKTAGYAYCYLNGTLRQMIPYSGELDGIKWDVNEFAHIIGGDQRVTNQGYFNRLIKSVTLYSDVRDAAEIYADASKGVNVSDGSIICHYDLSGGINGSAIADASGNGFDMVYQNLWLDATERDPDSYAYSMAIVGDTQILTEYFPEKLANLYNWIIENKDSKKISFVMGLGDINSNDTDAEWAISSKLLESLATAGIPQSIVCGGNHDSMPQFAKWLNTDSFYNAYSGIMEMGFWEDPTNGPTFANAYSIITIGETKYMFVTLEYGPKAPQVEWANEVIAAHPDCNVILSTHSYLYVDGTHHSAWDNSCPSGSKYSGDELWDGLVRHHENIVMVLSGHVAGNDVVKSEVYGDNGNKIIELLVNPQVLDEQVAGSGMIGMLYFSADGKQVDFEYYSTAKDQLYREGSQFSFEMNNTNDDVADIINASISVGNSINVNYCAHIKGNFNTVQMKFTVNGVTIFVNGEKLEGLDKYRFVYAGIAPQMMGDVIRAELIVDGVTVDVAKDFSVEMYAKALLNSSAYDLTLAPLHDDAFERTDALHETLRALLGYGSEAQGYKDYETDSLVGENINAKFDETEIESVKSATAPVGTSGAKFTGATVRFDSVNYLRFDFTVGEASLDEISVTIGGKTYTADNFIANENGTFSVYSEGIYAIEFNKAFTASLVLSGEEVHTATYSVNSYVKAMHESESIGELAKAIYLYGKAASAFYALYN